MEVPPDRYDIHDVVDEKALAIIGSQLQFIPGLRVGT